MEKVIQDIQMLNGEGELITTDVKFAGDKITEIGPQLTMGDAEIIDGAGFSWHRASSMSMFTFVSRAVNIRKQSKAGHGQRRKVDIRQSVQCRIQDLYPIQKKI